jgi:hypothetical protein
MNKIKYQVIKKANGKFAPRISSGFGSLWFNEPYEYESFSEACEAVLKERQKHREEVAKQKEEVVFTLDE